MMGISISNLFSDNSDIVVSIRGPCINRSRKLTFSDKFLPSPPMDIVKDFSPTNETSLSMTGSTQFAEFSSTQNNSDEGRWKIVIEDNDVTGCYLSKMSNTEEDDVPRYGMTYFEKGFILALAARDEYDKEEYKLASRLREYSAEYFNNSLKHENLGFQANKLSQEAETFYLFAAESKKIQEEEKRKLLRITAIKDSIKKNPNIKWSDVAGLEGVKKTLEEAFILPFKFPHSMTSNRKPPKGILLYGLRGTGKSLLAKAIATAATHSTFFSVDPSNFLADQTGECEQLVKSLFDTARQQKPGIIFLDTLDMLSIDSLHIQENVRKLEIEISLQMQGMNSYNDGIIVLGATSTPWNLSDTVLRLFEKKIHVPLPDEKARLGILKKIVGNTPNSLHEDDFKTLVRTTEGYSGKDIDIFVSGALRQPLIKAQTATHFVKVTGPSPSDPSVILNDLLTPCSACEPGAIEMSWLDITSRRSLKPIVTMDDMLRGLANSKPPPIKEDLLYMKKFMEDFGLQS